jgi:hypothetical protein
MATTFFNVVSAIRLKTTAFLRSLFLFPYNTALQVVHLFPNFRQTNQPVLPCSTSSSASSAQEARNTNAGDGSCHSDDDMAAGSSATARGQHAPASKIVSALPRTPPGTNANRLLKTASATDVDGQLIHKISQLELDESDTAAGTLPNPLPDTVNGGTGNGVENGVDNQVTQNGSLPQQSGPDSISDNALAEVTRTLPVPLAHTVSQTSKPKETATTLQLDGVTVQIQDKAETPEQAAERAMHSRFMREALDMVSIRLFPLLLERGGSLKSNVIVGQTCPQNQRDPRRLRARLQGADHRQRHERNERHS